MSSIQFQARSKRRFLVGFTLVELLVAMAVLIVLLGIVAIATQSTTRVIHQATSKLDAFATARASFNTVGLQLSQATLNTYWDYYGGSAGNLVRRTSTNASTFQPVTYGRASDLQFLITQNTQNSGYGQELYFQCPQAFSLDSNYQSTQGLLNACGYYVQYGSDLAFLPSLVGTPKWRYRLMQGLEPTENLQIFQATSLSPPNTTSDNPSTWLTNIKNSGAGAIPNNVVPLAQNVICMIAWPRLPEGTGQGLDTTGSTLTTDYTYDSQANVGNFSAGTSQPLQANQLPPTVQLTLVVIDEPSAVRIDTHAAAPPAVIENALAGLFQKSSVTDYTSDLAALQTKLAAARINFEILNTTVVMRESKWSQ